MEKIEKMFIGTLVILLITLMIMNIVQMHNYDLLEKTNDKLLKEIDEKNGEIRKIWNGGLEKWYMW